MFSIEIFMFFERKSRNKIYLLEIFLSWFVIWKTKFLRSQLNANLVDKTIFSFLEICHFEKLDRRMRIVNFIDKNFENALVVNECVIDLLYT